MTGKNNNNLIADVKGLISSVKRMYEKDILPVRDKIYATDESEIGDEMFDKSNDEDEFALKLNSIDDCLDNKDFYLAKNEILNAKKLIQKRNYREKIGSGNLHNMLDYFNEAFIQLNHLE